MHEHCVFEDRQIDISSLRLPCIQQFDCEVKQILLLLLSVVALVHGQFIDLSITVFVIDKHSIDDRATNHSPFVDQFEDAFTSRLHSMCPPPPGHSVLLTLTKMIVQ